MSNANNIAIQKGTCGENLTWKLDEGGTLTISGTGDMQNYNSVWDRRDSWRPARARIAFVIIEDGVTSIGNDAFSDCSSLTSVEIPNSVTIIGSGAFYGCSSLTSIELPNSVTHIGEKAFKGCSSLTDFNIPDSVVSIRVDAFCDTAYGWMKYEPLTNRKEDAVWQPMKVSHIRARMPLMLNENLGLKNLSWRKENLLQKRRIIYVETLR